MTMVPASIDISCFVPAFVQRRLQANPIAYTAVGAEKFPAALLFADVAGFSRLAERLSEWGAAGAEQLTQILNAYYGQLIDIVTGHGGDIVSFAGDAVLGMWPATDESLSDAVCRAVQSGAEVQDQLHDYEIAPGVRLSLRISIASGEVQAAQCGGIGDQWQFTILGEPWNQLRAADKLARNGDLVLSATTWKLTRERILGEPLPQNHCRVTNISQPLPQRALASIELSDAARRALRAYVPRAVLTRFDAGQGEYLADLRRVTVMFLNVSGHDSRRAESLQSIMHVLQTTAEHYEGTVVQLTDDDKGTVGIVAFGLPPFTHEDDAVRSIRAANVIRSELCGLGMQSSIGIATGRVFCGPLGSSRRRVYTTMGSEVNLAARLMQHASRDILCDRETERSTRGRVAFQPMPKFLLKGMAEPVTVFRPQSAHNHKLSHLVGRNAERVQINGVLDALQHGTSGTILIEGEGGIGKSTLIGNLLSEAATRGLHCLAGASSAIEKHTPYFAWREVFIKLLNLEQVTDPQERRSRVQLQLQTNENRLVWAPLLNQLLGVDFAETELVAQQVGRIRADNLHELLIDLLLEAASQQPLLIVLEDVHWLDSASWRLALTVQQRIRPLGLVLSYRPLPEPVPREFAELSRAAETIHLKLEGLSRGDCLEVVRSALGVALLSDQLADYFNERAEGNPFFATELACYMRDAGFAVVKDGGCDLTIETHHGVAAVIPTAISDLITSRVDQLSLPEQMTLKTASVIGRTFTHSALKAIYPLERDRDRLIEYLQMLDRQELTRLETEYPVLGYMFRHVIIQQTAYDQLPVANRRLLHRGVAQWHEEHFGEDPSYFPLLAHHWGKGEVREKHLEYLVKSGIATQRVGAHHEAERFFQQTLEEHRRLHGESLSIESRRWCAYWERLRGDSLFHLGQLPASRVCLERALELLGQAVPTSVWQVSWSLLTQGLFQAWRRVGPRRSPRPATHAQESMPETLYETALINQRLAMIHYFENHYSRGIDCTLRALNAGESAPVTPPLSRAYSNMCVGMSLLPWRSLAERYAQLAVDRERAMNDQPALCYGLAISCLYRLGCAQWPQVRHDAGESVALSERLGDLETLACAVTIEAMCDCFVGDFANGFQRFGKLWQVGSRSRSLVHQAWGLCGQGECRYRLGEFEEAIDLLNAARKILADLRDQTEEIRVESLLAMACWRYGQHQTALNYATETLRRLEQCACLTVSTLEGAAAPAEVYLQDWERHSRPHTVDVAHALTFVKQYANRFPIGQPRMWRLHGLFEWLQHRPTRALRSWQKSFQAADRLALDPEAGMALYELGRHAPLDCVQRRHQLTQAQEIFANTGMRYEQQLVLQELSKAR